MDRWCLQLMATLMFYPACFAGFPAQNTGTSSNEGAVITQLSQPVYPPLAKQTRIAGDVTLAVFVKPNGDPESVTLMSGHPLLAPAALDSAKHSKFECRNCGDSGQTFQLTYEFELVGSSDCEQRTESSNPAANPDSYPKVIGTKNRVTLIDQPASICDPAISITRVRSLKCLYLWRCGFK